MYEAEPSCFIDFKHRVATLYDKIWDDHVVCTRDDGLCLLYIDRHLLHEVTSPQAFEGMRAASRQPWRIQANLATPDHAIPTRNRHLGIDGIADSIAREQVETLDVNCKHFNIRQFELLDSRQGIVHVIGPEQGAILPGMTVVCGDSHTSTHGALGALAHGIGTSEVEHVLVTQCLVQQKSRNMKVDIQNSLQDGVYAKDIILALIGQIGTAGATGFTIEYMGEAIESLSMEGRMTICNMSIEAGARAGLIAVDDTTLSYIQGRPFTPTGSLWDEAEKSWRELRSDEGAAFDATVELNARDLVPQVTWGTNPQLVIPVDGTVPDPSSFETEALAETAERALKYMELKPGDSLSETRLDRVFVGSCTNARIEDLRAAATIAKGRKVASTIKSAFVVPGSGLVKLQAESEGLDQVFLNAGFEWRDPGCSMCLAMNDDVLAPGERCAATSNRNFEGRQGYLGRTHLVSPATAAASAIAGTIADARDYLQ